jgi:hypothetical protein
MVQPALTMGYTVTTKTSQAQPLFYLFLLAATLLFNGCAKAPTGKMMEATAYCGESGCGNWERGSYRYLKLDFWNRYYSTGPKAGRPYSGKTASGTFPHEPEDGLFSMDSLQRPWMIPMRIILFPWYLLPEDGTIAADTSYYPFGTRMYVPGYGWGVVEDRGGAIKGPERIDLYFQSLYEARQWGRRRVHVTIQKP